MDLVIALQGVDLAVVLAEALAEGLEVVLVSYDLDSIVSFPALCACLPHLLAIHTGACIPPVQVSE